MDFDPDTFPLEADLSRADVRVLYQACKGRSVVEFGCGGSTVMLAAIAARVVSYETDPAWVARTQARLAREPTHSCAGIRPCGAEPPEDLPRADVYFIDGYVPYRAEWLAAVVAQRLAETIIVHDSRSSAMSDIFRVIAYPLTLSLRSMEFHVDGSNLLVVRAGAPVEWENWNETEPANRLPHLPSV